MYICIHVYVYTCVYIYMYMNSCMYSNVNVCLDVYVWVRAHVASADVQDFLADSPRPGCSEVGRCLWRPTRLARIGLMGLTWTCDGLRGMYACMHTCVDV